MHIDNYVEKYILSILYRHYTLNVNMPTHTALTHSHSLSLSLSLSLSPSLSHSLTHSHTHTQHTHMNSHTDISHFQGSINLQRKYFPTIYIYTVQTCTSPNSYYTWNSPSSSSILSLSFVTWSTHLVMTSQDLMKPPTFCHCCHKPPASQGTAKRCHSQPLIALSVFSQTASLTLSILAVSQSITTLSVFCQTASLL